MSVTGEWKVLHRLRAAAAERLLRVDLVDGLYLVKNQSGVTLFASPFARAVEAYIRQARRRRDLGAVIRRAWGNDE